MKTGLVILLLLVIVAAAAGQYTSLRNGLAAERAEIEVLWTQVEAAFDHRDEILPELEQTVEGEAPKEAAAVKAVTDARTALRATKGRAPKIQANARVDNAVARLMLCVEGYPRLDGSPKYSDLLEALKDADYRIAVARRKYNEAVEHYNTRIALFPHNVVARLAGFGKIDAYIQTPPEPRP
jgi:LemA protein